MVKFEKTEDEKKFFHDQAFKLGYACRGSVRENPYKKDSGSYRAWDHGWHTRVYGETI